ncbi:hypothetical protein ACFLZZ_00020 [Nanoarchaeota archaeon]
MTSKENKLKSLYRLETSTFVNGIKSLRELLEITINEAMNKQFLYGCNEDEINEAFEDLDRISKDREINTKPKYYTKIKLLRDLGQEPYINLRFYKDFDG